MSEIFCNIFIITTIVPLTKANQIHTSLDTIALLVLFISEIYWKYNLLSVCFFINIIPFNMPKFRPKFPLMIGLMRVSNKKNGWFLQSFMGIMIYNKIYR